MRFLFTIAALAAFCFSPAAEIVGAVKFGKTSGAMLTVGYVGKDKSGQTLRNSCGMTVGTESSMRQVKCTTYSPRNSELIFTNNAYTFKHSAVPPGNYYVYAKLGTSLIAGKAVAVSRNAETKRLQIDLSPVKTGNLSLMLKSKGNWKVRLAPANAQGKPLINGLNLGSELQIEGKAASGRVVLKHLAPGKYIVYLLKITSSGVGEDSHWEAYEDAGTFSVEVAEGKTLEYKLNRALRS